METLPAAHQLGSQTGHARMVLLRLPNCHMLAKKHKTQTDSVDGSKVPNVDLNKLASWLTRITPKVLEELDKNSKSRAFDDYKLLETSDCSIKHLYDLNFDKETAHSKFVTSGIDWSSTGGMIAVSRCCKEHPSWCDHTGCVLLHKTYRNESSTGSPRFSLDVSACVTTLCAHPSDSFIISCGTYSGEINVWNLQRDEPIVVGSVTLHTESVVHMEWVQNFDVTQTRPVLVSASRDGSVVIWAMKTVTGTLRPIQCFLLQDVKDNLDFGIACAKFNPSKPSLFIAGLEGGSIAICSSERRYPCNQRQATFFKDLDCCNPVLKVLDGHKGAVTGVQWIPENKELFISCGTDSELRVYSISEVNLVRIIHLPELSSGLEVCTSHPNIAILYGLSGTVHLLNVLNGKQLHPLDIASDGVPLSTIRLRTTSSLLLALGNAEGKVSVWQIPHSKFIDVNGM